MPIKDSKIQSPLDDHYIALFEQSPFSMQIMSPEGLIIKVNKAWEELWGLTLDQLDGYNILKDEQLEKMGVMPYIKSAFDGQFTEIPPVLYDPNETLPNATRHAEPKRWTKAVIYPVKNSAGQVREVVLMLEDITAEKQAEEKTKANESRYHSLLENTSDIIYSHDLQGNYLSINSAGEKTTGYSLEELEKMNVAQLIAPEHLERAKQMIERKSHDHTPTIYELDIITKDGCRLTLEINSRISSIKGQPLAVEGIARDITARKLMEKALRVSESRYRSLLENANDIIYSHDLLGNYVAGNGAAEKITGYSLEELEKMNITEFIVPEHHELIKQVIERKLYDPTPTVHEFDIITKDGRRRTLEVNPRISSIEGEPLAIEGVARDVTERKLVEKSLRESEEKYRGLFNSIDEGFCIIEMSFDAGGKPDDFRFLEINPSFERMSGLENAVGKTVRELIPDIEEFWIETYGGVALTGKSVRFENRAEPLNRWFDVYAFRLSDADSRRVAIVFSNITGRKQAEEDLRKSEERLRLTTGAAQMYSWEIDLTTQEIKYSENVDNMFNLDLLPKNFEEVLAIVHPEDREKSLRVFERARRETGTFKHQYRVVNSAKKTIWLELHAVTVRDAQGNPVNLIGITQNITESKQAEERLRESEARFRAMFEQANVGIVQATIDGQLIMANPGFCKIMGYTEEEACRLNVRDITHKDDYERETKLSRQFIMGEIPSFSIEKRYVRKDGNIIWGNLTATLIHQASGEPFYTLRIIEDISERKRIEEVLRGNEERLRLLIESASDYAIFAMTLDNRINAWNTGAEKVFGWTESEALGQSGEIIFTPEDCKAGAPEQEIKTALEKGHAPDERFHLRKDGSRFYVSGMMTLLKNGDGKVQGFVKIARDISERLKAEKAVRDKEILQRIVGAQEDERKRIARDLHDELGQQLTALRLKLDSTRKMCKDKKLCDKIDEMQLIAKSVDNGVNFLAWELRPPALDDLGLVAAIGNYVKQWSHHSGIAAELLASSLKKVRLAPEVEINFFRIVQEALTNTYKHAKAKNVEIILKKRDDLIVLIIEDNGKGFNPKVKKDRRKGIGLIGMKERAELIGGTFEIESAPGQGTTVYVRIPNSLVQERRSYGG